MLTLGCHLSSSKGFLAMGQEACRLDGNTFQFFTRNPRGGKAKALDENDAASLQTLLKEKAFGPIIAHAPYTLNPCSADEKVRDFARMVFEEDFARLEYLAGTYYNFHPGSHVGQGIDKGIAMIAGMLNDLMKPDMKTTVLLETMAGKGTEVGSRFEELRAILDQTAFPQKMGVCLDTCHVWDAGYDIMSDLDGVLQEFDQVIGLKYLKALHLNDSKNPRSSHKDRHEKIGQGHIGIEAFVRIVNHPVLRGLPMVLETPNELEGYAKEIALLRNHESN